MVGNIASVVEEVQVQVLEEVAVAVEEAGVICH